MGSEVTNDKKKKGEITDVISKWIPLLTGIIPLLVAIINAILILLNYDYSIKAEDFYGIPSKYFLNSIIDNKIMIFVTLCLYCVMLWLPFILKKLYRVKKLGIIESIFHSFVIACVTVPVVLMAIIRIIGIFNLGIESSVVLIVSGIIFVLTFIIYIYLFMKDISNARKEDLEKQESITNEEKVEERNDKKKKKKKGTKKFKKKEVAESDNHEIKGDIVGENTSSEDRIITQNVATKSRFTKFIGIIEELYEKIRDFIKKLPAKIRDFIKELPALIFAMVLTIAFIASLIITADRVIEIPQNKNKYELVTINEGDKGNKRDMAVVSYKNGKAVLMDYTVTQAAINGNEIEILQLTKGKYRLSDIEGHQIEYKEFDAVKCE